MKKAAILFVLSIIIPLISVACLPEGITFSTQSEIDEFSSNYPDCTVIEGDVIISGGDISNLLGLSNIILIQGNLEILNNYSLNSFQGLDNLIQIEGELKVSNNNLISDFTGLSSLETIDGDLIVSSNSNTINFMGLTNLTIINQNMELLYSACQKTSISSLRLY